MGNSTKKKILQSTLIEVNINFADNILSKFLKQSSNAVFQSQAAEFQYKERLIKRASKKTPKEQNWRSYLMLWHYLYLLFKTYLTDICHISKKMLESITKHCYK